MRTKIYKSTRTGGCPICAEYPELAHNCMMEDHNSRYITAGVDPVTKEIFNHYLAVRAAKTDPEIAAIVREAKYQFSRDSLSPKFSELVVPSYNRIHELLSRPYGTEHINRRDRRLI